MNITTARVLMNTMNKLVTSQSILFLKIQLLFILHNQREHFVYCGPKKHLLITKLGRLNQRIPKRLA
jgi:hypothetical protein